MTILLRMDDTINRKLVCPVYESDTPMVLAQELVHYGFINEVNVQTETKKNECKYVYIIVLIINFDNIFYFFYYFFITD